MHDYGLITTLAAALTAAFVLGFITQKLGLSPILGYLLAGIAVGPFTPGFVADAKLAAQFAEIGVILLMFGVGLHFHLKDLLAVRKIALPGAIGQSLIATGLGTALALSFGWSLSAGLVLGMAISVASTVVLMRVLSDHNKLDTPEGHIAVGWLVVEDIFTVLLLVLLPAFAVGSGATGGKVLMAAGASILKLAVLGILLLGLGSKVIPWLLVKVARTRSNELFTLSVLVCALVIATGSSALFGASMALGAFLAGMVVGQSSVSHQAAANALPMRDAFAVLFFVAVGMLFDPGLLLSQPLLVACVLGIILIGKPLAAVAIVVVTGYSVRTALTVAVGLAQIGEFSFILAEVARGLGLLPAEGYSVLVAASILSITLNPLLFRLVGPIERWLQRHPKMWTLLNRRAEVRARREGRELTRLMHADASTVQAVVVGYGPVGRTLTRILREFGLRPIIIDMNVDTVSQLVSQGQPAIYGDAKREEILRKAGLERATYLLVTLPEGEASRAVVTTARTISGNVDIFVRARYLAERDAFERAGATAVAYEEAELAVALAEHLLQKVGAPMQRIEEETNKIRDEFAVRRFQPIFTPPPPSPPANGGNEDGGGTAPDAPGPDRR